MESAAKKRRNSHSKSFERPRNAKSRKCDESGMGRDESGKPIGHLAKAGRIETNQEGVSSDVRRVHDPSHRTDGL